jgi:hypothetical protein
MSKNWQARAKAYDEIAAMFKAKNQDAVRDHASNWKK